jgi:hypothetical protein
MNMYEQRRVPTLVFMNVTIISKHTYQKEAPPRHPMALPNLVQVVFKQRRIVSRVSLRAIMHVHQLHLCKKENATSKFRLLYVHP